MRPIRPRNPATGQFVTAKATTPPAVPVVMPTPAPAVVLDQPAGAPAAAPDNRPAVSVPVDAATTPVGPRPAASAMPVPQAPAGRAFQDSELDPFTLDLVAAAPVLPAEPAPVPVAAPAVPTSRRGERPESSGRRVLVAVGAACLTGLAGLLAVAAGNRPKKAAPLAASVAPAARPQPIPFTRPVRAPEVYKDAAAW